MAAGVLAAVTGAAAAEQTPPNIVLIVLDDLDYADLGAYGSPRIRTPFIDGVSDAGARFTHYYASSPVCSPSRAGLLTGLEPARFGFRQVLTKHSRRGIPASVPTLAERLRQAGYHTAHVGKWHLGTRRPEFLPVGKGFDVSVRKVSIEGAERRLYSHYELVYDERRRRRFEGSRHLSDVLTDEALRVLENAAKRQPFFLNLWYLAPHMPSTVPSDFDNSETRYELSTAAGRHAALVTHIDRQIGRVLARLDALQLAQRTLVLITSDNGGVGSLQTDPERPVRGAKRTLLEGGLRVPLLVRWPGRMPAGRVDPSLVTGIDVLPSLAEVAGLPPDPGLPGRSFLPLREAGGTKSRPRSLFWEAKRSRVFVDDPRGRYETFAVRQGDWKLLFADDGRLHLFDVARDPREKLDRAADRPDLVRRLLDEHARWRREVSELPYEVALPEKGVRREGDELVFDGSGGPVTLEAGTLVDFHDGDFSVVGRIDPVPVAPGDAGKQQVIAGRVGSWSLALAERRVVLTLEAEDGTRAELRSAPLAPGPHDVAFTLFAWKRSPSTVRLYVDGALAEESLQALGPIRSTDAPIVLGNTPDLRSPFRGRMRLPRLSLTCLQPEEFARYDGASDSRLRARAPRKIQSSLAAKFAPMPAAIPARFASR